jgi:hypothetical protein
MSMNPRLLRPTANDSPASISGLALWLDAAAPDALYTTDAGPVTAVSSPLDIAGCALWLDGDQSVTQSLFDATSGGSAVTTNGGSVARWEDKSGNGRHFVQSSAPVRPTLSTAAKNGRSVVTFDATDDYMISAATQTIPQPATWMFVYKVPSSIASGWTLVDSATDRVHVYSPSGDTIIQYTAGGFFTTEASGVTADQWRIGTYHFNGASSLGKRDGVQTATGTTGTNASTGNIYLGANFGIQFYLRSQMAEAILLTGASMADIARVEAYLAAKWGISGVHAPAVTASDPVGYWRDRSGNGRHATQSTAASRPVAGTQNSRKALAFSGINTRLTASIAPSDLCSATGGSVFVVVAPNTSVYNSFTNAGAIESLDRYGSGASYYGNFRTDRLDGVLPGCFNVTGAQIIASIASVGAQTVRKDGATVLSVASQIAGYRAVSPSLSVTIGATLSSVSPVTYSYHLNGNIAEIICYNKPLSENDARKVEQYLAARWNIPIAPLVANAEAQDWIARVYAAGGAVSTSTASAVSTFCDAIESAGIRDRFYRLGIFAGSNLNAALVPLYRGPTFGGTTYGNTTDTNNGPFVSGDYVETGVSGGLNNAARTKHLDTGFATNTLSDGNRHLAAYARTWPNALYDDMVGSESNAGISQQFCLGHQSSASQVSFGCFSNTGRIGSSAVSSGAFWLGANYSSGNAFLYRNGVQDGSGSAAAATPTSSSVFVFAINRASVPSPTDYFGGTLGGYSIGLSMDAAQAAAYNTAMQSFQTALTRNV